MLSGVINEGAVVEQIYLLDVESDELEPLQATAYPTEQVLQQLVANHPELLAGGIESSGGLVLVDREMAVPDEEAGSGRWGLDHLFVDAEAVPTFVEVKRQTDRRLRRQVVGQILDYAAHGSSYWTATDLQAAFAAGLNGPQGADEKLADQLGADVDPAKFWTQVQDNLRAGRVRLIIVAGAIPHELRRVVEFLNGQMTQAELLAIEVKQFTADGRCILVPTVYGQTAAAEDTKARGPNLQQRFKEADPAARQLRDRLLAWADQHQLGLGQTRSQFRVRSQDGIGGVALEPSRATLSIYIGVLADPDLDDQAEQLHASLEDIAGSELSQRAPGVPAEMALEHFELFTEQLIDRYWQLRRDAGHTGPTLYG